MPDKQTLKRVRKDAVAGKSAGTQAGEFIREEMHHIREGKHGARSTKQAIAIGLSKARRAGVELRVPAPGKTSKAARQKAAQDVARGRRRPSAESSSRRARASLRALKREGHLAASRSALSRQAKTAARKRSASARSASARKAAATRERRG